jgi:MYXO-CTERM domain-containing protein
MKISWTDKRLNRIGLGAIALFVFACSDGGSGCSGGGCGGCGGEGGTAGPPYVYPPEAPVMQQAAQVHVTERGFDFIEENAGPLIGSLLGDGGLSFCIGKQDLAGIGDICGGAARCDDGSQGCQLSAGLANIALTPETQPAADRLNVSLGIVLDERLSLGLAGANCWVDLDSPPEGVPVSANVYFNVGAPPGERVSIDLPSNEILFDAGSIDIGISGQSNAWDAIACGGLSLATLIVNIGDLIGGQLTGIIDEQLGTLLCRSCADGVACGDGQTCTDDVCYYSGTQECAPLPLGTEMQVDIGSLLADFAPGLEAKLGILFYLANYADAIGPAAAPYVGLDLAAQAGFTSEPNACVPYQAPPDISRYAKSSGINTETTPSGEGFALGIGLARRAIDFALWAVYNSGTLCLKVGSETVSQLSSGTFSALIPSINDLTGGDNTPMYLQLRPQQAPTAELGLGTISYEDDGTPVIEDPLITLHIDNLDIDFYIFAEDRYLRVFTLNTDVALPLGLDVNANNEIVVLLGDLTQALVRIEALNGELLKEREVNNIASLLPGLLGSLLPSLLGDGGLIDPIAIPDISGLKIVFPPGSFTSVDDGEMLAVYADLALAPPEGTLALRMPLQARIEAADITTLPQADVQRHLDAVRLGEQALDVNTLMPRVLIDVSARFPGYSGDFEFSYRVDGGLWSFWHRGETLHVVNPVLALQGEHLIEIRARQQDDSSTVGELTDSMVVVTDYGAPLVSLERSGDAVLVDVTDSVAADGQLMMRYRVNGGAWVETSGLVDRIDLTPYIGGNALVEVEATDGAGNSTTEKSSFNLDRGGIQTVPVATEATPEGGCASTSANGGWAAGLGLLGVLALRRRRRAGVVAAATLMVAGAFAGCSNEKAAGTTGCDPACADGQVCEAGVCVDSGCGSNEDCPEGEICNGGICTTEGACEGSGDCEAGLICVDGSCVVDNSCETAADCEDGQICLDGQCTAAQCDDASDCGGCEAPQVAGCYDGICACEAPCAEGCADGTACCYPTNSCVEVNADCADQECPVGTRLQATEDPQFDNTTCTTSTTCECVELPPLPIGDIGRTLDVAVSPDGSQRFVSAYNATYGDLMVGEIGADNVISWSFVDGLPPTGAVTGSLNGPRGGIAVPGPNVGEYSSIEMGADGALHVSYYASAGDEKGLRYAYGNVVGGEWSWKIIALDGTDAAGRFTDLVLDGEGRPIIVYTASEQFYAEGLTWTSQVRALVATSAAPADAASFNAPVVIDSYVSPLPCGGTCGGRENCRGDRNVCVRPVTDGCDPACAEGQACFDNEDGTFSCATATPAATLRTVVEGIGLYNDAEWVAPGVLGVAHYQRTGGNLRYSTWTLDGSVAPTSVTVDGEAPGEGGAVVDTGDVGWFPDLYVDTAGAVWIAYADSTRAQLKVANLTAATIVVADDGLRCFEYVDERCVDLVISRVGDDAALGESGGQLSLVYQDTTWLDLWETVLGSFGWETPAPLAGDEDPYDGAFGFYSVQGTASAGRFVLTHRMHNRATPAFRDVVVIPR